MKFKDLPKVNVYDCSSSKRMLRGKKCAYLDSRSCATKVESLPKLFGSPSMKSIEASRKGMVGANIQPWS